MIFFKKLLTSFVLSPFIFIWIFLFFLFRKELKNSKFIKIFIGFIIFFIYFFSIDLGKDFLFYFLEKDYLKYNVKDIDDFLRNKVKKVDLVVVLGGGADFRYQLSEDSFDRLFIAFKIYKLYDCDIFLSGGYLSFNQNRKIPVSLIMKYYLLSFGVKKEKILLDSNSKDTFQNFQELTNFLKKYNKYKNIIIVSSGFHILRSKHILNDYFNNYFNNKDFDINFLPASIKFNGYYDIYSFIPSFYNFSLSFVALKEYIGILYYKLLNKYKIIFKMFA